MFSKSCSYVDQQFTEDLSDPADFVTEAEQPTSILNNKN